jgi:hypothetical protein
MNRTLLRRVVAAGIAGFSIAIFTAVPTLAQTRSGNGFRISPVRSEYTIEKGHGETLNITIENPSDAPTRARGVVNDFVASDKEDGEPRLILDENAAAPRNSFKSLVGTIPEVDLAGKQKKDIQVAINVPSDANAGGYYGAIRFVPINAQGQEQGNVGLTASVGTIVLVRVPGNLKERLDLVQLSAAQNGKTKNFFTSGNLQVVTRLKNEGDIHVKPFGRVIVKDIFGHTVSSQEFNSGKDPDSRANILPASTRRFTDNLPKRKWLGRYTIEANLGYTQGSGELISAKSTFWYMPLWSLIALLILILVVVGGITWLINRFKRK